MRLGEAISIERNWRYYSGKIIDSTDCSRPRVLALLAIFSIEKPWWQPHLPFLPKIGLIVLFRCFMHKASHEICCLAAILFFPFNFHVAHYSSLSSFEFTNPNPYTLSHTKASLSLLLYITIAYYLHVVGVASFVVIVLAVVRSCFFRCCHHWRCYCCYVITVVPAIFLFFCCWLITGEILWDNLSQEAKNSESICIWLINNINNYIRQIFPKIVLMCN